MGVRNTIEHPPPSGCFWHLPLVKNYYHAKFRASSSKIDQVIGLVRVWKSYYSPTDYTVQTLALSLDKNSRPEFGQ